MEGIKRNNTRKRNFFRILIIFSTEILKTLTEHCQKNKQIIYTTDISKQVLVRKVGLQLS